MHKGRIARIAWGAALLLVASTLSTLGLSTLTATPAAAAPVGCGYANNSASNGQFASTICWFDFTSFNMTQARSTSGQAMQVTLDGGYVAKFTVRFADVAGTFPMSVERRSTPLETRFAFGQIAYRGVPGLHSLYSLGSPPGLKGGKLSFENIQIVDGGGAPVTGFRFVAADTEDNVSGESFTWTSDKELNEIERLAPAGNWGCKTPLGLGTMTVTCAGTGVGGTTIAGGRSTALLVAADTPTNFSTQWITANRSGLAIGLQTAKLTVVKQVASRIAPTDDFTVSIAGPSGTSIASAATGTTNSATTGTVNVLAGGTFTLSEAVTAGSPTVLGNYVTGWSCTNVNTSSTTVLPSGAGTSNTVTPKAGDDITCTITNTAKSVGIGLQKHAGTPTDVNGNGITDIGDTIAFTFTVTNTGAASLENIAVSDPKVGSVTCPPGTLASGAQMTCTAASTYTVALADSAAGAVNNSATASGSPLNASIVVLSAPSTTSTPVEIPSPALTLVKSATPSVAAAFVSGQPIAYSFVVTNTGNITIDNVTVTDTVFTGSGTLSAITCPAAASTLVAGEQATCTASYTLTQDDVDAGTLENTARASGTPVGFPTIFSAPSSFALPVDPAAAVTLAKSATPATAAAPGDVITYSFAVTNSGNVSLSAPAITETAFSPGGTISPTCPAGTFLPGATMTCTATYTLTQSDVNAGTVTNTAFASATAPSGATVNSVPDSATVTIPSAPLLTLTKSAVTAGTGIAGDSVTYSFLVSNAGNVTIDDLTVDETTFTGTGTLGALSCPQTTLDAAESVTCTAPYVLTQADVDNGRVDNTAVATGDPAGPAASVSSPASSAAVTTARAAALTLAKTVSSARVSAGDLVTYSFVITNTGTVSLSAVSVTETAFGGTGPVPVATCPGNTLAPGDSLICVAPYTVTNADARAGGVTNTATAAATSPTGVAAPTSNASTAAFAVAAPPVTGPLALTGSTIVWTLGGLAVVLLVTGGALVVRRRRRQPS